MLVIEEKHFILDEGMRDRHNKRNEGSNGEGIEEQKRMVELRDFSGRGGFVRKISHTNLQRSRLAC